MFRQIFCSLIRFYTVGNYQLSFISLLCAQHTFFSGLPALANNPVGSSSTRFTFWFLFRKVANLQLVCQKESQLSSINIKPGVAHPPFISFQFRPSGMGTFKLSCCSLLLHLSSSLAWTDSGDGSSLSMLTEIAANMWLPISGLYLF